MSRQLSLSALASVAAMALFALTFGPGTNGASTSHHSAGPFSIGVISAR